MYILIFLALFSSAFALEKEDETAIHQVIQNYTDAWNLRGGTGFGDGFAENADFVNVFGMKFTSREEIEMRHRNIITTFFKGSTFEILNTLLREIQPGVVIAIIDWRLKGFREPGSDLNKPGETREGIFTQVFTNSGKKWEIIASQNTIKPKQ